MFSHKVRGCVCTGAEWTLHQGPQFSIVSDVRLSLLLDGQLELVKLASAGTRGHKQQQEKQKYSRAAAVER